MSFGDLTLEEMLDKDETCLFLAECLLEANDEEYKGLPDLEVVESDDDDEGRPQEGKHRG